MVLDATAQTGVAFLSSRALPDRIAAAKRLLPEGALHLVPPQNEGVSYLAGSDAYRTEALLQLLDEPRVSKVLVGRGGYGAVRLDMARIRPRLAKNPKPLVGFSDVTALLALWYSCGIPALHGPVLTQLPILDTPSLKRIRHLLLEGRLEPLTCRLTPLGGGVPSQRLSGPLLGGNLSVLQTLIGLDYAPDYTGKIVFLEDVNEPAYKLDRISTHLLQASTLSRARAVVLGEFLGCTGAEEAIAAALPGDLPLYTGFPAGHGASNTPFLWGALASITPGDSMMTVAGGLV